MVAVLSVFIDLSVTPLGKGEGLQKCRCVMPQPDPRLRQESADQLAFGESVVPGSTGGPVESSLRYVIQHVGRPFHIKTDGVLEVLRGAKLHREIATPTGGPCQLSDKTPDNAVFLSFPVCLDPRCATGGGADFVLPSGSVRFVLTTHGLGMEVYDPAGKRTTSYSPLIEFSGNALGAPPRKAIFEPSYSYIDRKRAHFYADVLGIWRTHVEIAADKEGVRLSVTVMPRYDGQLAIWCQAAGVGTGPLPVVTNQAPYVSAILIRSK